MMLTRSNPVALSVKVLVNGKLASHDAVVKPDKSWVVDLEPQTASSSNNITIVSSAGHSVVLTNVAFGDVYLCSGQVSTGPSLSKPPCACRVTAV